MSSKQSVILFELIIYTFLNEMPIVAQLLQLFCTHSCLKDFIIRHIARSCVNIFFVHTEVPELAELERQLSTLSDGATTTTGSESEMGAETTLKRLGQTSHIIICRRRITKTNSETLVTYF